jgi:hypothetical protein
MEIKNNCCGTIAKKEFTGLWTEDDSCLWFLGNMSCDCNRALEFHKVLGLPEPRDRTCGLAVYSVRVTCVDTGVVLYSDMEDQQ